jgi:type IV secretory pathway VirJ component
MKVLRTAAIIILLFSPATHAENNLSTEVLRVAGFGDVSLYAPEGQPSQVVLFVSGDGGWNLGVIGMAERLRQMGALVAGIDIRSFMKALEASGDCAYPAGSLEQLSRTIQLHRKLPVYETPILVGYSSGATLVYEAIASAPPETFAGAISLGFCPDIEISKPLCELRGAKATKRTQGPGYDLSAFAGLKVPWMVLQGEIDQVCSPAATKAFVSATGSARVFMLPEVGHGFSVTRNWEPQFIEAFKTIAVRTTTATITISTSDVAGLSLVEVPAVHSGAVNDVLAIILTGDGGWVDLDKTVAAGLAEKGIPTVGWSSLRYYWTPRTPDAAAADLTRIIRHYLGLWNKSRVVLIGYSFGADVLPFLANRLPADVRGHVASAVMMGLSDAASFEFHIAEWIGRGPKSEYPTVPEIEKMTRPAMCIQGADEVDSGCRLLKGGHVIVEGVGKGHHFSGQYDRLVALILRTIGSGGG